MSRITECGMIFYVWLNCYYFTSYKKSPKPDNRFLAGCFGLFGLYSDYFLMMGLRGL